MGPALAFQLITRCVALLYIWEFYGAFYRILPATAALRYVCLQLKKNIDF